jgi:NAD(P)-dependent dehydrogenase (short-subunit alcohol dehydrogenase family)
LAREDTVSNHHWTADSIPDQGGRVAIVTGANTGIGKETARALATKGARVVLACRSEERGKDAVRDIREGELTGAVELELLDLSSLASVRDFADRIKTRYERLDLLINNAGVMMPPASKTAEGFELQIGINHLGHFALTGLLMDLLLATEGSRVVTVSSEAHKWGEIAFDDLQWESRPYKKMAAYGQSKLANLLFTYELQRRLDGAGAGTRSLSAHPGWTATDLQRGTPLFRFFNPVFAMKPWQGALPTLRAAADPEAPGGAFYGPHGFMNMRGFPVPAVSTPASHDEAVAGRLWETSEALTGVHFPLVTP